ncbi:hypothetical protein F5880DRAFT_1482181 [Lentinula raphanica]|nr:hypothetical protein F5880DRAFT_1482181 [Lentinula raphanica]
MSSKRYKCTICNIYTANKAAYLRNHWSHSKCGDEIKGKQVNTPLHNQHQNLLRASSPALSVSSFNFAELPCEPPACDFPPSESPAPALKKAKSSVTVEDVLDEDDVFRLNFVSQDFVGAGAVLERQNEENMFHRHRKEKESKGEEMWAPFASQKEWQLVRWLMLSGVSHGDIDTFAKLDHFRDDPQLSFKNKRTFFKKVDALPTIRGGWTCKELEVVGDVIQTKLDGSEAPKTEELELWTRDPVECIKELMEDPRFRNSMRYVPEKMFTDDTMKVRAYDEMWTGDWWWATQLIPKGGTVAPLIIASDKTQLSSFSGDKEAWPVYLTLGNIAGSVRRKPSEQASVLIGYIPVSKLECFTPKRRAVEGYRLFHECMRMLLEPLVEAGNPLKGGIEMLCSDGRTRVVYPIFAAYVADYPEQCLVAGCGERKCPKCTVSSKHLGDPLHSVLRDPYSALDAFEKAANGDPTLAENLGLRDINPFWKDLPLCNIFHCFTPDILHQLHKGVFKDHLVKWSTKALHPKKGAKEIDARFQSMPRHNTLRHFKKGISLVSQWTGNEYKNMEKVFLGVIAGAAPTDVVICVRAVLDFIEYSQFSLHTEHSLEGMNTALNTFHDHQVRAFIEPGIRKHFNIPKIHSMVHDVPMIRSHGSATNFNTEWSERLHIDFAKLAYRASSKRGYIKQMTKWLDRREKVLWFTRFLDWLSDRDGLDWLAQSVDDEDKQDSEELEEEDDENKTERSGLQYGESRCNVAKRPPLLNLDIETLETSYGCSSFVHAMERFLRKHDLLKPDYWDATPAKYNLYKLVRITLPPTPEISDNPVIDVVRATASQSAVASGKKHQKYVPARFDTVLAWKELPIVQVPKSELIGLQVAQVRAIFELPTELGTFPHPLAYVEWFTPLRKLDTDSQMFRIERSERNHHNSASIIPVTHFFRSCHLIPYSGKETDQSWTSETSLDNCTSFQLNPYLRLIDFVLLRHRMK